MAKEYTLSLQNACKVQHKLGYFSNFNKVGEKIELALTTTWKNILKQFFIIFIFNTFIEIVSDLSVLLPLTYKKRYYGPAYN